MSTLALGINSLPMLGTKQMRTVLIGLSLPAVLPVAAAAFLGLLGLSAAVLGVSGLLAVPSLCPRLLGLLAACTHNSRAGFVFLKAPSLC